MRKQKWQARPFIIHSKNPEGPRCFTWNKSGAEVVGFEQTDSFCEGGRREQSPRSAALTKNLLKHPAESWVHQKGHGLGVRVMPQFKGLSQSAIRRRGTSEYFNRL